MDPINEEVEYEMLYEMKLHEFEELKQNYEEYVESSKELEKEMDSSLKQALGKNQELEKRLNTMELKYKSLQDNYDRLSKEFNSTLTHIQTATNKLSILEENKRHLENENEDLVNKVRILESTEQDLQHQLEQSKEDLIFMKNDLEILQEAKQQEEITLKNEINTLRDDVKRGLARRRRSVNTSDFGMDSSEFHAQEHELQKKEQENLELTVRELAQTISELETENGDLQGELYRIKKRLTNGVIDRSVSLDPIDEVGVLRDELEALNEVIQQKDTELEGMKHLKDLVAEKDERLKLIENQFIEMLSPTFKAANANSIYRMVPSSIKTQSSHLQIDSTTSVMGRLKSFLGSDDAEKLKKELIKMVRVYFAISVSNSFLLIVVVLFCRLVNTKLNETAVFSC
jgi:chromosome segregation ATPase